MNYFAYSLADVVNVMKAKGYKVFEGPNDLNIVGVRTSDDNANSFNDWLLFFDKPDAWRFHAFQATTDPGLYYREHPANVNGTAILTPGQHRGMWMIGAHRGQYEALVQAKPVPVWRDNNKDEVLNQQVPAVDKGLFGINMHRASASRQSTQVDKWSAGCQVFANPQDFDYAMALCKAQVATYSEIWKNSNSFTYTLIESTDLEQP